MQRNEKYKTSIGLSLLFISSLDEWTLFYTVKGLKCACSGILIHIQPNSPAHN